MPHRLVWGFEHADKVGRGCRSKLAWVLVGQHRFGRGSREVHWTWHQTGTSAGCADVVQRARGVERDCARLSQTGRWQLTLQCPCCMTGWV